MLRPSKMTIEGVIQNGYIRPEMVRLACCKSRDDQLRPRFRMSKGSGMRVSLR